MQTAWVIQDRIFIGKNMSKPQKTGSKASNYMKKLSSIFFILAVLCAIYFAVIVFYAGVGTAYCFVWLFFAAIFILMAHFVRFAFLHQGGMPKLLPTFVFTTFGIFSLLFVCIMFIVMKESRGSRDTEHTDYTIVLGSRVYPNGVSKTLMYRLERALVYYHEHPETTLVLTGGQDSGDSIPEALAMFNYFSMNGVPTGKMLINTRGTSTAEVIAGAVDIIAMDMENRRVPKGPGDKILPMDYVPNVSIITSDYHIMRSVRVAENQGIKQIAAVPARSDKILFLHQCVRESAAIVKDYLMGNFTLNERQLPFDQN